MHWWLLPIPTPRRVVTSTYSAAESDRNLVATDLASFVSLPDRAGHLDEALGARKRGSARAGMPPKKKGKKSAQLAPLPARLFSSHVASLHPTYLSTLTSPEALSDSDILAAYGLIGEDPEGKGRCRYLWKENFGEGPDGWVNGSSTSSEASKGKKGKGKAKDKAACDEAKCSDDPRCLNWLGQEHWADPGLLSFSSTVGAELMFDLPLTEAALKTFKKNLGLTRDPSLDDRDPLLPVGLKVRQLPLPSQDDVSDASGMALAEPRCDVLHQLAPAMLVPRPPFPRGALRLHSS